MRKFKHTPEEARKLWVEALRSGKYKQARHALCVDGGYCCLGVACEVFCQHERKLHTSWELYGVGCLMLLYEGKGKVLPKEVMEWIGLDNSGGRFFGDCEEEDASLSSLNDDGSTFDEIANIIESNPPGLFVEVPA